MSRAEPIRRLMSSRKVWKHATYVFQRNLHLRSIMRSSNHPPDQLVLNVTICKKPLDDRLTMRVDTANADRIVSAPRWRSRWRSRQRTPGDSPRATARACNSAYPPTCHRLEFMSLGLARKDAHIDSPQMILRQTQTPRCDLFGSIFMAR